MSIHSAPARRGQCQTVHDVIAMYLPQARRDLSPRSYETVACILRRFERGQFVLDDDFEPVYGVWILAAEDGQDEPVIVQAPPA
jgi:hypothetical protein